MMTTGTRGEPGDSRGEEIIGTAACQEKNEEGFVAGGEGLRSNKEALKIYREWGRSSMGMCNGVGREENRKIPCYTKYLAFRAQ